MRGQFTLEITLANQAMHTEEDVARALVKAAKQVAMGTQDSGRVLDDNGNTVGTWEFAS